MQDLRFKEVEEIQLPMKYRRPAAAYTMYNLINQYDSLRNELLMTLKRLDDVSRGQWHAERQLEAQTALTEAIREENQRLQEAGRYALYGKLPPEPEEVLSLEDDTVVPT
jgi:hypothetical protein